MTPNNYKDMTMKQLRGPAIKGKLSGPWEFWKGATSKALLVSKVWHANTKRMLIVHRIGSILITLNDARGSTPTDIKRLAAVTQKEWDEWWIPLVREGSSSVMRPGVSFFRVDHGLLKFANHGSFFARIKRSMQKS